MEAEPSKGKLHGRNEAEDRGRADGGRQGRPTHHRARSARGWWPSGRLRERRRGPGAARRTRGGRQRKLRRAATADQRKLLRLEATGRDRSPQGDGLWPFRLPDGRACPPEGAMRLVRPRRLDSLVRLTAPRPLRPPTG